MGSAAILVGVAVWVATLYAIRHWIAAMPPRLWAVARDELGRARDEHDAKARKALHEAAAKQVGELVKGIRNYHDEVAAQFRRQVADVGARARVSETRAVDTAVALETANALVRELRAALDDIRARNGGEAEDTPDTNSTPQPANGDDEQSSDDADEQTKVIVARSVDPLRVPVRKPPPVPRAPLPPAVGDGQREDGATLPPLRGAEEKSS